MEAGHVWEWFGQLSRGRPWYPGGPGRLSWTEIAHWSALSGAAPTPWELRLLLRLDDAYVSAHLDK